MTWPARSSSSNSFCTARYFIGFFVDLDMRQNQRRIDGEGAEQLSCLGVVEIIETALERLAIERDDAGVPVSASS